MPVTGSEDITEQEHTTPEGEELRATFIEHLGELRTRIMRAFFFVALGWVIGYNIFPFVAKQLNRPFVLQTLHRKDVKLIFQDFAAPFMMQVKVGLFIGLVLALPFITMQAWGFVAPGLTPRERRGVRFIAPLSVVLFIVGTGFGYWVLPSAMRWFMGYLPNGTELYQNQEAYLLFVIKMLLAFGLAFQLPVVILFLAKAGIATPEALWKYWRHATVAISVAAMVLTPSNDAVTMLAMAIPMVGLYFLSIFLVTSVQRGERKRPKT